MAELGLVDRANWYELYKHKDDGTFWRLAVEGKFEQRFLVRIDDLTNWSMFDSGPLEKALLLHQRGGLTDEVCIQQGCSERTIQRSAFCLNHTFLSGVCASEF